MTQYANKTFAVHMGANDAYRDNWERTFRKDEPTHPLEHAAEAAVNPQEPDSWASATHKALLDWQEVAMRSIAALQDRVALLEAENARLREIRTRLEAHVCQEACEACSC